ncbi:DMT family transporter [Cohnella sp. REN36]|uniref:DMT family transporter n=1 Tax=Cohnella sp. REN36 TaxID=2887347 RepID=UPI001D13527C|nr:DMT family transporter [Cohnella sp. REN36]MCC3372062.1 DMT family transporter [Cohnella sp. REN36]
MIQNHSKKAYFAAVGNACIVGLSFLFVKTALAEADPIDTLSHRFTVSLAALLVAVWIGWMKVKVKAKDVLSILPLAVFYPALFFAFQAFGMVNATSSEAGIIQATVPIFTMALAVYFLKEQSSAWQKASIFLSVAGVVYLFIGNGFHLETANIKGTVLILLSVLSLAGYSVWARKLARTFKAADLTMVIIVIGFLVFNSLSVIRHLTNGTLSSFYIPFQKPLFTLSILYLGILSTLVTAWLSNFAFSKIEATKLSVFNHLATLVALAGGVAFLGEKLAYSHLIGAGLIILGVTGANFLKTSKENARDH